MKVQLNCPRCNTTSYEVDVVYSASRWKIYIDYQKERESVAKERVKKQKRMEEATTQFNLVKEYNSKIVPRVFLHEHFPELEYDAEYVHGRFSNRYSFYYPNWTHSPAIKHNYEIVCPVCGYAEGVYQEVGKKGI